MGKKYFQERNASSLSIYSIKQQMNHLKGGQLHSCGQLKIHCIFRGKEILVADPLESKDTPEKKKKKKILEWELELDLLELEEQEEITPDPRSNPRSNTCFLRMKSCFFYDCIHRHIVIREHIVVIASSGLCSLSKEKKSCQVTILISV